MNSPTNEHDSGGEERHDAVAVLADCAESDPSIVALAVEESLSIGASEIPFASTELIASSIDESFSQIKGPEHQPSFISATVLKVDGKATDTGISFENANDGIQISDINPEGMFSDTPIREGDYLLSVDNTGCGDSTVADVSRLIRRSKDAVTLVVRRAEGDPYIVSTMVTKPAPESRVGIGIQVVDGSLCVSTIDPSGLFAGGILNVGDKVISIGGVPCPSMDSTSAVELIRKERSTVTIVAWTEQEAGVVVAATSRSFGSFCVDLLWSWRKNIMIISITFTLIAIIGIVASQTGTQTACEDLGQRPLPVARECP